MDTQTQTHIKKKGQENKSFRVLCPVNKQRNDYLNQLLSVYTWYFIILGYKIYRVTGDGGHNIV